jgi:hypothetical protein
MGKRVFYTHAVMQSIKLTRELVGTEQTIYQITRREVGENSKT